MGVWGHFDWVMGFLLLLKLLYCKVTGFLLLGMGHVIRTASSANWTVYFTAKHGQKGSIRVPVPRFDLYKYWLGNGIAYFEARPYCTC